MKKWLNRLFIDGLSGMATGLFSTLIVGTIIQQVGNLIGGNVGNFLFLFGKTAAALTGAGIGCGVACKFKESPLVVLSAATSGMVGAFASSILNGSILMDGALVLSGPGEPLGAFIAAYVGINRSYLYTLFRDQLGMSPKEYLTSFRITRAAQLLEITELSIESVALSCGYQDTLGFSKIFKARLGMTPSAYRKRNAEQQRKTREENRGPL